MRATLNRKARRVAKAKGRSKGGAANIDDAAIAERIAARFRRQRAERAAYWASVTDAELLDMRLEESAREADGLGGPWFLPLLIDAVPLWIQRHAATPPDARVARAHALGELIAYSQASAAIADPDARGTERKGSIGELFNAVAEGLAIGAYCPGGALFAGHLWQVVDGKLRTTTRTYSWQATLS